jgi:hypothetical protein
MRAAENLAFPQLSWLRQKEPKREKTRSLRWQLDTSQTQGHARHLRRLPPQPSRPAAANHPGLRLKNHPPGLPLKTTPACHPPSQVTPPPSGHVPAHKAAIRRERGMATGIAATDG